MAMPPSVLRTWLRICPEPEPIVPEKKFFIHRLNHCCYFLPAIRPFTLLLLFELAGGRTLDGLG